MKQYATLALLVGFAMMPARAEGENSVTVESKTVITGQAGATIGIRIANDVDLQAVAVPLEIREVTPGAFITGLSMSFGDRMTTSLTGIRVTNQYAEPDGDCGDGQPSYGTVTHTDGAHHPVAAPPEGVIFVGIQIADPPLTPGADVTGSMILTVDVGATSGTFEIDTTCVAMGNHLSFFTSPMGVEIVPSFTRGTITIRSNAPPVAVCGDVVVAAGDNCTADASIDAGSFDPDGDPLSFMQIPPGPYPLGHTAVELFVSDGSEPASSCFGSVTVVDTAPPTIICSPDITVPSDTGVVGAVVNYAPATALDNCSPVTVTCMPPSGSFFPIGSTQVTCTATDNAGNTETCTFSISVQPPCNDIPLDVNCDGLPNVLDIVEAVNAIFRGDGYKPPCCIEP